MTYFSQRDPHFCNVKVGTGADTIEKVGCKLTSLANLLGKNPVEVNEILTRKNAYTNGELISDAVAAVALGLDFYGTTKQKPEYVCVAETDSNKPLGVPQHFFLYFPDDTIVDPWDINPQRKPNNYHVVSYRLFQVPHHLTMLLNDTILLLKDVYASADAAHQQRIHDVAERLRKAQEALNEAITQ